MHKVPLKITAEGFILYAYKKDNRIIYKREHNTEVIEKVILTNNRQLLINPVEPVNKPKSVTTFLLIDFEKPTLIEPKLKRTIFLKFPLEFGVFVCGKKGYEILDIFSFTKLKYTLYGEVRNGVICKYWQSKIYSKVPNADPMLEGILEVTITNSSNDWINLSKVVINAYGMQLYYNQERVSLKTTLKILSALVAETEVIRKPLWNKMKPAIELYTKLKPPVLNKGFVMEAGL